MLEIAVSILGAAFIGWIGSGLVWGSRTSTRIAVLESKQTSFERWLAKVEGKLDRVIETRSSHEAGE